MIEGVDHDDLMGAEESGEEDKKEVCIQVKLGKEDKTKPSLDRYSFLFVFIQFIQVFIICIYKSFYLFLYRYSLLGHQERPQKVNKSVCPSVCLSILPVSQ